MKFKLNFINNINNAIKVAFDKTRICMVLSILV